MTRKFFKINPLMFVLFCVLVFPHLQLFGATYQITVGSAQIEESKTNGKSWDVLGGLPDTFFKVFVNGNLQFSSSVKKNSCTPAWNETFTINFNDGDEIVIDVFDEDGMSNDLIGRWKSEKLPNGEISHGSFRNLQISVK